MKFDKEDIIEFLKANKHYLKENFEITSISLFGSFARGEETDESDIDIFVEMPPDLHKLVGLIGYLENAFNKKVHVVRNRQNLSPRLTKHIFREKVNA